MLPGLEPDALQRLSSFYDTLQYQTVWNTYGMLDGLLQQFAHLADDGLDPAHYQPERIREQLYQASATPLHRECSDILTSHNYLEALHHLADRKSVV